MNNYLDFQWKDFAETSTILNDSHFIKNNHLAIWPVLSNQGKHYNITDSTHYGHNIMPNTALHLHYLRILTTLQTKCNKAGKRFRCTCQRSDTSKWWNQNCVTPKSNAPPILPVTLVTLDCLTVTLITLEWKSDSLLTRCP